MWELGGWFLYLLLGDGSGLGRLEVSTPLVLDFLSWLFPEELTAFLRLVDWSVYCNEFDFGAVQCRIGRWWSLIDFKRADLAARVCWDCWL